VLSVLKAASLQTQYFSIATEKAGHLANLFRSRIQIPTVFTFPLDISTRKSIYTREEGILTSFFTPKLSIS
jgi:hypothetical protein